MCQKNGRRVNCVLGLEQHKVGYFHREYDRIAKKSLLLLRIGWKVGRVGGFRLCRLPVPLHLSGLAFNVEQKIRKFKYKESETDNINPAVSDPNNIIS